MNVPEQFTNVPNAHLFANLHNNLHALALGLGICVCVFASVIMYEYVVRKHSTLRPGLIKPVLLP